MPSRLLLAVCLAFLSLLPATASGARFPAAGSASPAAAAGPSQGPGTFRAYLPLAARLFAEDRSSLDDPFAPGLGNRGYDVASYDLAFTVAISEAAPSARYDATATIEATSTEADLDRVAFDFSGRPVTDVRLAGAPVAWYMGRGNKLWVSFPRPLNVGEPFRLRFQYAGVAGGGAAAVSVGRAGQADAQVWTAPGNASAWFPANDHPSDRARFRFRVNAPKPYVSVANGRRVEVTDQGETSTAEFETAEMATSEAMINIAKYTVIEGRSKSGVALRHYLLRTAAEAAPTLRIVERQLDYFGALVGPYPFATFGLVDSGINDRTSVQSLFVLGRNLQSARPVYFERSVGSNVAAQWFGSALGVATRRDNVLNAGLAQYLGVLYLARDQGPELIRSRMEAFENSYANAVATDLSLTALTPNTAGNDVANNKGPFAFHALRHAIGHEAFARTLRAYFADRQGRFADLDALQRAAEKAAGGSLAAHFDANFRGAKTPRLNLAWSSNGTAVEMRVCQLTPAAHEFALPVMLRPAPKPEPIILNITGRDQLLSVPYAGQAATLTPDPDQELLADVIVFHAAGGSLPGCAAMPLPALPRTASVSETGRGDGAAGAHGADTDRGVGAGAGADTHGGDSPWNASAELGIDPVQMMEGKQYGHPLAVDRAAMAPDKAAFVPGEPSMGDEYLAYLGNTGYDVQRYAVKLVVDPDAKRLEGDATLDIRGTIEGLDRMSLDFMRMRDTAGLTVTEVTVGGAAAAFERPADADKLWIDLPAPVVKNGEFQVRIRYAGTPVPGGDGSFTGGLLFFAGPSAYAVNEPDGTRNWIPSNDHPRDKALYHFEITVPITYVVAANGTRGAVTPADTHTTYVYDMPQPMSSYLATVAVANYRTAEQAGPRGIPIVHYFQNDPADGLRVAGVTPDVLDYFSRVVAPYPFDSYGHFAATSFSGGMENQTMTAIGVSTFSTRYPRSSHGLIAHEAAHQWFGDALSPYVWNDIWLNEGFATYFQRLWSYERMGPEPLSRSMEGSRYTVLNTGAEEPLTYPAVARMFGTNSYSKGAWVLHMMRHELGEEVFWQGMHDYFQQHLYGNVRTDDLQAAMETAFGRPLDDWFDQWAYHPGNPTVRAAWRQTGTEVSVRLCQGDDLFDLPLTIAVHGGDGTALNKIDPIGLDTRIDGAEKSERVEIPFNATGVTLDPDFNLLADLRVLRAGGSELPTCQQLEDEL